MTKQALQKELLEKLKPGAKPSDIKRLKRSKSVGDIPTAPAETKEINQLKQQFNTQLQQINSLFDPQAINYTQPIEFNGLYQHLKELLTSAPAAPLLHTQLNQKQTELEQLRTKLETANQNLTESRTQLDNSLEARTKALSDWTKQREQIRALSQELDETIDQASSEINQGDSEIVQLRTKIWTLKSSKEKLERELKLSRINRGNLNSPSTNANNHETFQYALYALMALWFMLALNSSWNKNYCRRPKTPINKNHA